MLPIQFGNRGQELFMLEEGREIKAEILPELIRAWRDMGYRFGTLDELCAEE